MRWLRKIADWWWSTSVFNPALRPPPRYVFSRCPGCYNFTRTVAGRCDCCGEKKEEAT